MDLLQKILENIYLKMICGPGDIAQAHQPNEFLLASQIEACEGFMRRMVEWCCR